LTQLPWLPCTADTLLILCCCIVASRLKAEL
jgi:hypothetical protein